MAMGCTIGAITSITIRAIGSPLAPFFCHHWRQWRQWREPQIVMTLLPISNRVGNIKFSILISKNDFKPIYI
jgi:hypothetical protein